MADRSKGKASREGAKSQSKPAPPLGNETISDLLETYETLRRANSRLEQYRRASRGRAIYSSRTD